MCVFIVWNMGENLGLNQDYRNVGHTHTCTVNVVLSYQSLLSYLSLCSDACDFILDLYTAIVYNVLCEENQNMTCMKEKQPYSGRLQKPDECLQVLCKEKLSGRFYWEAEWLQNWAIHASVIFKGFSRKGSNCRSQVNEVWSLDYSHNSFMVWHKNKRTVLSVPLPHSKRVGVYLDWWAGTLSFYSVSDTHTHSHTYTHSTPHSLNPSTLNWEFIFLTTLFSLLNIIHS